MRLAFSVAINVDADVLLIDEILGVGDVSFQKKCFEKLQEIKKKGTTIVIVSHSMEQVEQICDRSIWIYEGLIRKEGKPKEIAIEYNAEMEKRRLKRIEEEYKKRKLENKGQEIYCEETTVHAGGESVKFKEVQLCNQNGDDTVIFKTGDTLVLKMKIQSRDAEQLASVSVSVCNDEHIHYYGTNLFAEKNKFLQIRSECEVIFKFENLKLMNGKYWINLGLYTPQFEPLDEFNFIRSFYVQKDETESASGLFHMDHSWELDNADIVSY